MNGFGSRKGQTSKYSKLPLHDSENDTFGAEDGSQEDDFIMSNVRSQQSMIKKQDQSLDMLGASAARLGEISMNISQEITSQNVMLDEMGDELDVADSNLATVTKKTEDLIKKSGGCQTFAVIVCLIITVVILLFLIIYT